MNKHNFYAVIIGSEILNGRRADKHFEYLKNALLLRGHTLYATFIIKDDEELIRTDNIDYNIVSEYGYVLEAEFFDFFGEDFEDEDNFDEKIELDESELSSFLNEYYTVNPNLLPKSSPY